MATRSWEKHKVNGITVRVKRLGNHRIEVALSDRKKDLQAMVCKLIGETSYADDVEHTRQGNLECRLLPGGRMNFNQLIQKVVNLTVRAIERYEKKMTTAQSHARRHKKRHTKQYRNRQPLRGRSAPVTT